MADPQYAATRTDDRTHIGSAIKEIIRLTLEEGVSWQTAADRLGVKRNRVAKALTKSHVRAYRLEKRRELIESLSGRVPLRLSQLMDGENEAACVRACLALEQMRTEAMAEPNTRQIIAGGIVIVLSGKAQQSLATHAAPTLELEPVEDRGERIGARD